KVRHEALLSTLSSGPSLAWRSHPPEHDQSRAATPDVLVGCAVSVGIDRGFAACRRDHVDIRVKARIAGNAGSDLEDLRVAVRAVLETMAVAVAGSKPRCVARAQCFLTLVGHEHHFARKDIDEFVFVAVPMTL